MRHPSLRSLATFASLVSLLAGCESKPAAGDRAASDSAAVPATSAAARAEIDYHGDFRGPLGIQLWSFREAAEKDPIAMLAMTRALGITHVETAGTYGMPTDSFATALRNADLRATSMHVPYEMLRDSAQKVIADAKALGVGYVGTAWYPHEGPFTEAVARKAIADFNTFGKQMKDAGLRFFYHNHGYEPERYGNETLLDLIFRETDPSLVYFEEDVLWTFLPNVDPAALIRKYPGRIKLMHLKDMKPGVPRGSLTGGLPAEQQAVIGEGQVNWSELLKAAKDDGVEHFYLEDETPAPQTNVPLSIRYLAQLKY
jgi:sugar phosphate isomerase/epimerase